MKNYFVSMYQVLKLIDYCSSQDKFNYSLFSSEKLGITDKELQIILSNALDERLITGIKIFPGMSGFKSINAHLTTAGYQFLEENSMMKKAYKTLKEIKGWIPGI
ncbi:hypothetical protein IX317_001657 [Fusobacterium sp. DD29]|uniref:YjcQ family protein n=1 Tax=unclassified Fusobacterium TaxID=2648384 RepID=UPI001B8CCA6C|nr:MULTISPECIES: YjcQ family protein [unclassified Fusobacterium]MBR8749977.1 hypothetical protein [Fusobacterium sp. DD29]MBR8762210.1 hypothetical protein [Fusobacterium sp. DD25]MBR8768236.1 hypothetical protein [Fusobacterium sp. DD43]MBR8772312.1 hypothetical protein [Fusobacterium sp. DD40]MBR8776531.1 hypothetical protein [Fusobacterium sp. DD17]